MNSKELRERFLDFFGKRGHTIVPSSSLIPDDPSVLLTTAGMQQFKPYYTGQADPFKSPHPTLGGKPLGSKNAASIQKSFRTSDIDAVGDERHLTFFEMMGNFSFGGYFKEEAIRYAYEFLKEIGLPIEYVTVFGGDSSARSGQAIPKDEESKKIWEKLGIRDIREAGREDNFWGPTGNEGPCGPTTEIYSKNIEIWNIVFNEYYCYPDASLERLKTPGVDTGMGLERLAAVSQEKPHIFLTDLFAPLFQSTPEIFPERQRRIIADHGRGIAFLLADGVRPSNKEAGYVLRRLIRRVLAYEYLKHISSGISHILRIVQEMYGGFYPELHTEGIQEEFEKEKIRFQETFQKGIKELRQSPVLDGGGAFRIASTFGIPFEIMKEVFPEKVGGVTREDFEKEIEKHREISRAGQERKFGGHGLLLDTGELKAADEEEVKVVTRLHTATHLLQAALRKVLGESVHQAGSDITAERTRFDFTFERKLTPQELRKIEELVNIAIEKDYTVEYKELPYQEAIKTRALYSPKEKYPPIVKVYTIFDPETGEIFSQELCGGPHVTHTSEIGNFKIMKEEAVGAGVRRIRGVISSTTKT